MREVSGAELDIAYGGPSFSVNKVFLSVAYGSVRIAFCEMQEPNVGPKFRTAVSMPVPDAMELAAVLKEIIALSVKQSERSN
jgi:hypothetical protein